MVRTNTPAHRAVQILRDLKERVDALEEEREDEGSISSIRTIEETASMDDNWSFRRYVDPQFIWGSNWGFRNWMAGSEAIEVEGYGYLYGLEPYGSTIDGGGVGTRPITVTVTDDDGQPIDGASVTLYREQL